MNDDFLALLKVHEYFRGISDEAIHDVARIAKVAYLPVGEVVHEPDHTVTSIRFVLRGRLKAVKVDSHGRETLFRMIERGDQLGMMVGALQEQVPLRIFTIEPAVLVEVDHEQAMELTLTHQDLRLQWLRTFAGTLRQHFFGKSTKRAPMMLGLIHESPASRLTARKLVERLLELGEKVAVFSDSDELRNLPGVRFRSLQGEGQSLEAAEVRQQATDWQDSNRIIFDIQMQADHQRAEQVMQLVDRAVYLVPASECDSAIRRLQQLDVPARGWRDKLSIAWLLETGRVVPPTVPNLHDFVARDFKLSDTPAQSPWGRSLSSGLERLVHDLRGVRIGVALGGGAARGMSHLGVLKALEASGIVVDMIAGTSAGALTGVVYATGLDGDYSADCFSNDLTPSWIFRHLPRGDYWFLLYQYRHGRFDAMLRKYIHDWKLEQLAIPCLSVAVDLVSGQSVVRERGDAVHAVLESINLPVLSVPICRNGQALVDGGLINNIPADVLASRGCNFIIAVSVTAKMEKRFGEITPSSTTHRRKPSVLQTMLRSMLVQNHNLNAIGVQPADLVIEPDVTGFELSEFMRAKELAAVGEQAALEQIPRIKQLLTRLDPQLFPFGR